MWRVLHFGYGKLERNRRICGLKISHLRIGQRNQVNAILGPRFRHKTTHRQGTKSTRIGGPVKGINWPAGAVNSSIFGAGSERRMFHLRGKLKIGLDFCAHHTIITG